MIDCLIIGFNDALFQEFVGMLRCGGRQSEAYRDLRLAFVEHNGSAFRTLDALEYFQKDHPGYEPLHSIDFLAPAILYLGSYLHRRGYSFDYVNLFDRDKDGLRRKLSGEEYLTTLVVTTHYVSPYPVHQVVSFVREHNRGTRIVMCGPYVLKQFRHGDPNRLQHALKTMDADVCVVAKEGEKTLTDMIQALKDRRSLETVCNIAFKGRDGDYIVTPPAAERNSLAGEPIDYQLFRAADIGQHVLLRTAKGCPYNCAYCASGARVERYECLPVERVAQQLDDLHRVGTVQHISFTDDSFNVPHARFLEILRLMIRKQYGFRWNAYHRCDVQDAETIELMVQSGCEGVYLGVESGSDVVLSRMNKNNLRSQYERAIPMLKDAGLIVHANLIVGFPGETEQTAEESRRLIEKTRPDTFKAQLWFCEPHTAIWSGRGMQGIQGEGFHWSHETMNSQTACDLIDDMVLSMDGSQWLPQYGYDLWDVYYLKRRGMSPEQIRRYLNCFRAAIREGLLFPERRSLSPGVLESLRQSCLFKHVPEPNTKATEALSGAAYHRASQFWGGQMAGVWPRTTLPTQGVHAAAPGTGMACMTLSISAADVGSASADCHVHVIHTLLAMYGVLLSWLSGREEIVLLASVPYGQNRPVFPIRVGLKRTQRFRELAAQVRDNLRQCLEHHCYGLYVLKRMTSGGANRTEEASVEVGFRYIGQEAAQPASSCGGLSPGVAGAMGLVLEAKETDQGLTMHMQYRSERLFRSSAERIVAHMGQLAARLTTRTDLTIGELMAGAVGPGERSDAEPYAADSFVFG